MLQDRRHVVVGHDTGDFEEDKFVGGGSTILERLRAALPWPLGCSASALQALSGSCSASYTDRQRTVEHAPCWSGSGKMDLVRTQGGAPSDAFVAGR